MVVTSCQKHSRMHAHGKSVARRSSNKSVVTCKQRDIPYAVTRLPTLQNRLDRDIITRLVFSYPFTPTNTVSVPTLCTYCWDNEVPYTWIDKQNVESGRFSSIRIQHIQQVFKETDASTWSSAFIQISNAFSMSRLCLKGSTGIA